MKSHPVNHNPDVLARHAANHPDALRGSNLVDAIAPLDHGRIGQVVVIYVSPPCLHFSKAKKIEVAE
jgi:DNA (cytosine-5)-methyltransferase 1